ncbi:MAG TPA: bifunctional (p)ppGpp synthetase/guanosine-3',5'-bis(diphosphate) 3'-pyrophosphohydrolase, partial [bacterium]|nr:bifunctional (p)ppGpp synthetase/guanosine-3',5'-bis(diphosphate) 3'-pyrophosphohydrolase [bacterium]
MGIQALIDKNTSTGTSPSDVSLDRSLIQKAYEFAKKAHQGQQRLSGDEYLTHLVGVADILAELHMDSVTIAAALLHDILEDTSVTYDQLKAEFGQEIADLVEGVTKISTRKFQDASIGHAESTRKMLVAMAKDVRVILIKLADRTHNMRTLEFLPPDRREKMAKETLDIYAPLAHRLGIAKIKSELEDLCFRYLQPDAYYDLVKKIAMKKAERERMLENVIHILQEKLKESGITAQVQGRSKHFTSIYHKMVEQQKSFDEIYDLMAVRVLTNTVKECYEALGMVHTIWKPLPGRFKDYVAMPKNNMYQSLHTTVMGPEGQPLEIQIRTYEMHRTAEEGIAAHWIYKEGRTGGKEDEKFAWMRQLLDLQQDIKDTTEFAQAMKVDLFDDEVFVFTPKGEVKELPRGATALDFAYAVHTDVGTHTMGVKVNGQMVPLRYVLKNGDIVEVLTQSSRVPSRDWVKIVVTSRAKNKIRHWFRTHLSADEIDKGKHMLEKEAPRMGVDFNAAFKSGALEGLLESFGCHSVNELLANTGHGEISAKQILNKLIAKTQPEEHSPAQEKHLEEKGSEVRTSKGTTSQVPASGPAPPIKGISIGGQKDFLIRFARCCTPVPGDPIVGYVTRGRGVSIHRTDCPNTLQLPEGESRMMPVSWEGNAGQTYQVAVEVKAKDREKLLADMLLAISEEGVLIHEANAKALEGGWAQGYFVVAIAQADQLEKVLKKLQRVQGVVSA